MPKALNPTCRSCGQYSPAGSKTCMHCGARMRGVGAVEESTTASEPDGIEAKAFGWSFDPVIAAICVVGLVALYVLIFVLPTHPFYFPLQRLFYAYVGVSIATACLVYVDAKNLDTKLEYEGLPEITPLHWFLLTLFMWPIGFPLYMLARAKFGDNTIMRAGLGTAALLLFLMLTSCVVISVRNHSVYKAPEVQGKPELKVNGQVVSTPSIARPQPMVIISSGTQVIRVR